MKKYIHLSNGTRNILISGVEGIMSVATTSSTALTLKCYQEVSNGNVETITITHAANVGAHDMKVWMLGVIEDLLSSNWKEVAPLQVPPRAISSIVYS
tara:strand:+ start:1655 stop:1948 length:294 start_codon:yes stop_codon:yes gene_type:complete